MKEHTPGPWVAAGTDIDAAAKTVAIATCGPGRTGEAVANARLIAAAPDMKEALEGVMRMTFEDLSAEESGEIIEAAVRALVKARG